MMVPRVLLSLLLSLPSIALAQGVASVHPVKPNGTALFPTPFASADNIAAQTATAMHGLAYIWDGSNWDRWTGAVTQSGTWNIGTVTTITNAVAVTGTFWQATQPVSAASLPLPTGAATSALQDGIVRDGSGDTTQANVSSGRLHVDGSGVTQPVSGTVTVTDGAGALNVIVDSGSVTIGSALPAGTNNIGDVDVVTLPSVTIGTFPDNEPFNVAQMNGVAVTMGNGVSGTGVQRVTIASDSTGTVAVTQATAANLNAQVQGAAATDAAVSGNPVLQGCRAEDSIDAAPGVRVSAEGDATPCSATRDGTQRVVIGGTQTWRYHENSSSALTDTTVHAAAGAGLFLYVCSITISNGAATALNVFFEEGASTVLGPYYFEAINGRGASINFQPCNKMPTANTALTVTTSDAHAHAIDMTGYIAE